MKFLNLGEVIFDELVCGKEKAFVDAVAISPVITGRTGSLAICDEYTSPDQRKIVVDKEQAALFDEFYPNENFYVTNVMIGALPKERCELPVKARKSKRINRKQKDRGF